MVDAVRAGARDIIDGLAVKAQESGVDVRFGVGNYTDLPGTDGFAHQLNPTDNADTATAEMAKWEAWAGSYGAAEAQFLALHHLAEPPDGKVGWRAKARRVIVWIGDAPGNDPIPTEFTGLSEEITERSVTDRLTRERIAVIAISATGGEPGLNADPATHAGEFYPASRGTGKQAKRIAEVTGGSHVDGLDADRVVAKIIELAGAHIAKSGGAVTLRPNTRLKRYRGVAVPAAAMPNGATLRFKVILPGAEAKAPDATTKWFYLAKGQKGELDVTVGSQKVGEVKVEYLQPDLTGTYQLRNTDNDMLLQLDTADSSGKAVGLDLHQDGKHQHWELNPIKGGGYELKNAGATPSAGRYLRYDKDYDKGVEVDTAEHSGKKDQQWVFAPEGVDERGAVLYSIQPLSSNSRKKALGIKSGSNPARLEIADSTGSPGAKVKESHHQIRRLDKV